VRREEETTMSAHKLLISCFLIVFLSVGFSRNESVSAGNPLKQDLSTRRVKAVSIQIEEKREMTYWDTPEHMMENLISVMAIDKILLAQVYFLTCDFAQGWRSVVNL